MRDYAKNKKKQFVLFNDFIALKGCKIVARWPQDGPKMAPRWPKMGPDGPKMAPDGPRWPQEGPR